MGVDPKASSCLGEERKVHSGGGRFSSGPGLDHQTYIPLENTTSLSSLNVKSSLIGLAGGPETHLPRSKPYGGSSTSTGSKLSKLEVIIWEAPPNDTIPLSSKRQTRHGVAKETLTFVLKKKKKNSNVLSIIYLSHI